MSRFQDDLIRNPDIYKDVFSRLICINKKGELAEALAREAMKYSIYDIQTISTNLEKELRGLPSPYKEKVRPYFMEQYFYRYYKLTKMASEGAFKRMDGIIKDSSLFRDYCDMVINLRYSYDRSTMYDPFYGLYYYLISCFAMFVLEEPGHPVSMPFPGGFTVQKRGNNYYCPIRDKEKDVKNSICNFCPALQDTIP